MSMNVSTHLVTGTGDSPRESRVRTPPAQSLLGREAGDSVPFQGVEAEIVSIEP